MSDWFAGRRSGDYATGSLSGDGTEVGRCLQGHVQGTGTGAENRFADAAENILNAPTKLMKQLGYSEGYEYDPIVKTVFLAPTIFRTA